MNCSPNWPRSSTSNYVKQSTTTTWRCEPAWGWYTGNDETFARTLDLGGCGGSRWQPRVGDQMRRNGRRAGASRGDRTPSAAGDHRVLFLAQHPIMDRRGRASTMLLGTGSVASRLPLGSGRQRRTVGPCCAFRAGNTLGLLEQRPPRNRVRPSEPPGTVGERRAASNPYRPEHNDPAGPSGVPVWRWPPASCRSRWAPTPRFGAHPGRAVRIVGLRPSRGRCRPTGVPAGPVAGYGRARWPAPPRIAALCGTCWPAPSSGGRQPGARARCESAGSTRTRSPPPSRRLARRPRPLDELARGVPRC